MGPALELPDHRLCASTGWAGRPDPSPAHPQRPLQASGPEDSPILSAARSREGQNQPGSRPQASLKAPGLNGKGKYRTSDFRPRVEGPWTDAGPVPPPRFPGWAACFLPAGAAGTLIAPHPGDCGQDTGAVSPNSPATPPEPCGVSWSPPRTQKTKGRKSGSSRGLTMHPTHPSAKDQGPGGALTIPHFRHGPPPHLGHGGALGAPRTMPESTH